MALKVRLSFKILGKDKTNVVTLLHMFTGSRSCIIYVGSGHIFTG